MRTLRELYHLARADFWERTRRSSFLILLVLTAGAGYLFVPSRDAGYLVLHVGQQRGIYNSPWIGLMFGAIAALQLPLLGFYLVKNAIERDRQTGVGQIIAATPTGKPVYVVGKWLSNLAVLALLLSILTGMAVVMQFVRAEESVMDLGALTTQVWSMGLPVLAIAAALAVLFECVPFLSRGLGNVGYFFLWTAAIASVLAPIEEGGGLAQPHNDLIGFTRPIADIQQQVLTLDPEAEVWSGLGTPAPDGGPRTFVWDGIDWTVDIILERAAWAGMAAVIALVSAIPFDRFDPALSRQGSERDGLVPRLRRRLAAIRFREPLRRDPVEIGSLQVSPVLHPTPLVAKPGRARFYLVLVAELRLMLKGQKLLWYAGAVGLTIACLMNPLEEVRLYLFPIIWLWPMPIWAQMGTRERRHNTEQIVFSAPHPVARHVPAVWLAGAILTILAGSGGWVRLALTGDVPGLLTWFVGTLFAPALALALGTWVGNSRAFQLLYILWWYIGPVEQIPAFDFVGATAEGAAMGMPIGYLAITGVLVILALVGRWRQVRI